MKVYCVISGYCTYEERIDTIWTSLLAAAGAVLEDKGNSSCADCGIEEYMEAMDISIVEWDTITQKQRSLPIGMIMGTLLAP